MNKLKSTVAVLILIFALFGAYLIISREEKSPTLPAIIEENNPVGIENIGVSASKNLTDILTQKIEESIGKENTEGFKTLNGQTLISAPKPEQLVEELVAEAQKNFDPESLRPKISEADLKIITKNTKEDFTEYFLALGQIAITANKKMPAGFITPENISLDDFKIITLIYEDYVKSLNGLAVPDKLTDIHKKQIELIVFRKNIYEKMANADQDPMTALLAVDELLKLDLEFATLKEDMLASVRDYEL